MVNVEAIHQDIMQAPRFMDLNMELSICRRLVELSADEFDKNISLIADIFSRLDESHSDAFCLVTSADEFSFFVNWARGLAESPVSAQYAEGLLCIADLFNTVLE